MTCWREGRPCEPYIGERARFVYNAAKKRTELQLDVFGTGFWIPVEAQPAYNFRDDFADPILITGPPARISSTGGWEITLVGGGDVELVDNAFGGGARLIADGNADSAEIALGSVDSMLLGKEPHLCFGFELRNLDPDFYAEIGFENSTATRYLKGVYEGGQLKVSMSDGGGSQDVVMTAVPDTSYHVMFVRFSDDGVNGPGSRAEIAMDGYVDTVVSKATNPRYPDPAVDLMRLFAFVRNDKVGGGVFRAHVHHVNYTMDCLASP